MKYGLWTLAFSRHHYYILHETSPMEYNALKKFLIDKMRMSHVYQPVMIRYLLSNKGIACDTEIAKEISQQDPTQVDYYKNITNNMVGKVLRSHGIVEKVSKQYVLRDYNALNNNQITELIDICNRRLDEYLVKRGSAVWQHRAKVRRAIPGAIKYEVFKRARFRCELCGCMDSDRALEVDHIVPKNLGGEDSINNYQALCYSCNSMKRDLDSTDFRGVNEKYLHRDSNCTFCNVEKARIVQENNLAYLVFDKYPVTLAHALVIPKRHFIDYFDIYQAEINSVQSLLQYGRELILNDDKSVLGFNIGVNSGQVAGQTVPHCHLHLIPRRQNDVVDPVGGIRNVIPGKGKYLV